MPDKPQDKNLLPDLVPQNPAPVAKGRGSLGANTPSYGQFLDWRQVVPHRSECTQPVIGVDTKYLATPLAVVKALQWGHRGRSVPLRLFAQDAHLGPVPITIETTSGSSGPDRVFMVIMPWRLE